jgi:uncharacterized protein (DUF58 family)
VVGKYLFFFLAALLVVAIILQEDFVFSLIYLLLGTYFLARWWGGRASKALSVERRAPLHLFLGEQARVDVEISNRSVLPIAWLQIYESLPPELAARRAYQQVISIPSKGKYQFQYWLDARRRGYYPVGPLNLYSGDVFGVVDTIKHSYTPVYLTVYPKIIPLSRAPVPSQAPLGTLRYHQPIFEDPSRVIGKRDYVVGDSLRRVDWKASASSGRLQVKTYEPSIALETQICLNLNALEYEPRRRYDDSELAIVAAASLANWVVSQRQAVGLATNGVDPLGEQGRSLPVPPRRGRGHLMRLLEALARVECTESFPLVELLQNQRLHLPWGATQILITPSLDDGAFDALFQARRSGLDTMIILVGNPAAYHAIQHKAAYFGFALHAIYDERDMDIWRK